MAPLAPRLSAGSVIQHYEVIRPLGTGGMGTVFLARDTRLGRLVAIKLLTRQGEQGVRRFLIEARATAQISHENIVVIHDVGEHEGTPYMVLEYLKGRTLSEVLRERRGRRREEHGAETPESGHESAGEETGEIDHGAEASPAGQGAGGLPAGRAVELMIPVVRALVCAHERGVVHRDLKPSNVLVTDTGVVKVLDFGIAKLLGGADAAADEGGPPEVSVTEASPPGLTGAGALLGTRPYMAPEQWRAGQIDHRTDIWAAGMLLAELVLGEHPLAPLTMYRLATIGRLDAPMPSLRALRPDLGKLASIIDRCLIKRMEDRLGSARELLAELEALAPAARVSSAAGDEERNPFAGLSAFQEADASRFFGRGAAVAEVVTQLAEQPLLAIVGPSGAGKSSFVRAGVIPALERAGETWEVFTIRPGPRPMAALAELLLGDVFQTSSNDKDREELIAKLRAEPGLLGVRMRALCRHRLKRGLLFVDQVEELYTLAPARDRAAFLACLGGVADDVGSPLRAVLAIRSDFLDRMAEAHGALSALRRGIVLLPPMNREGLREALVRPLEAVEHLFEPPELVDEMLDALEHTSAALPLLSFTAARLWEQRDRARRALTEESYRRMGGIGGALAGHADAVLRAMSAKERRLARGALLRLVTPERTRALCILAELRDSAPVAAVMDRVLGRLIDARLLTVEGGGEAGATVEIVHESLISGWPMLVGWVAENQEDAVFLSRLRNAAKEWDAGGRSEDLLWRGRVAEAAGQWRERYSGKLSPEEEHYLRAVVNLAERARRRRRRLIVGAMAVLVMSAAVVSILASWAADRAEALAESAQEGARQARNATRMAAARELQDDPTMVFALLREVEPPSVPRGWYEMTRWALHTGVARAVLSRRESVQFVASSIAWSPDGKHIVAASGFEAVVWNADGTADPVVLRGHEAEVSSAVWSPDGKRIVTATWDRTARVWSADGTADPVVLRGHEGGISSAAWSPDGKRIVTASSDKTARVWSADGMGAPTLLRGHEEEVLSAVWSPDGKRIVTTSSDKTARVWSADGTGEPLLLRGHELAVMSAAWSPDGKRIVTASFDATARVWSADGTGEPLLLRGHELAVVSAAWSPDGKRIVTASSDRTARVWSTDGTGKPLLLRGHEDEVLSAVWSPDGKSIATASSDRTARVWSADGVTDTIVFRGHQNRGHSTAWSPDCKRIATVSVDNTVRVWDAARAADPSPLRGHEDEVLSAAWSPDGKHIVTASSDRTARVWSTDGKGPPLILRGHEGEVTSAAWSPDGKRIATASSDRTARVWSADGTGEPLILRGHEEGVKSAAWSPDGKRIVTASLDKTARVWSADGKVKLLLFHTPEAVIFSAAWSPDGKRIVTASGDGLVRVWSADGRDKPLLLRGHEGAVSSAAWSPDGKRIVTASLDTSVRVWNADATGERLVLRGASRFFSAGFSPDGKHIVAGFGATTWVWFDVELLRPAEAAILWTATTYCMPIERRIELLGIPETTAQADLEACQRRVAAARAPAP